MRFASRRFAPMRFALKRYALERSALERQTFCNCFPLEYRSSASMVRSSRLAEQSYTFSRRSARCASKMIQSNPRAAAAMPEATKDAANMMRLARSHCPILRGRETGAGTNVFTRLSRLLNPACARSPSQSMRSVAWMRSYGEPSCTSSIRQGAYTSRTIACDASWRTHGETTARADQSTIIHAASRTAASSFSAHACPHCKSSSHQTLKPSCTRASRRRPAAAASSRL